MEDLLEKDKTSELAEQKLAQMKANDKANEDQKKKEESKDASSEKSSTEKEKTEGKKDDQEEAKKETKTDVVVLDTDDKDLTEEELERKKVLIKQAEDAKTPEQKQQEWQEKTQKRIDELSGALKASDDGRKKDASTIQALEDKISELKGDLENSGSIDSELVKEAKTDEEIYLKMAEEDKDKPKETRREMSEEDLEEFLLENYTKANEWIVRRELRREKDRNNRKTSKEVTDTISKKAQEFFEEYPECNKGFIKQKELVSQGKTEEEALDIVSKENKDFAIMMDCFKSDPKFSDPTNGPELLSEEMKKRKSGKTENKTYSEEEVEQMKQDAIESERKRIESIDEGITSSTAGGSQPEGSQLYKDGLKIFIQAGKRRGQTWTEKDYKETLQYGRNTRRA